MFKCKKQILFDSYEDDVVKSADQSATISDGYVWINNKPLYRSWSYVLYKAASLFSIIYCCMILKVKFENHAAASPGVDKGCFIYGNHTQPVGDVFSSIRVLPFLGKKRLHVLASPANLGIPVLGRLLPAMGALPLPNSIGGMKRLKAAIETRINQGRAVVIYPEAHVWPYYTDIRPFAKGSFKFPVESGAPAFCMTTTYQQIKGRAKPQITIYIDGPFYADERLSRKMQSERLAEEIRSCMTERSKNSTCQYIEYVRRSG